MKISAIKKEDRGIYYCIAENGVGRGARRNVDVEVQFGPVVTVSEHSVAHRKKSSINLECHIESFPSPAILWQKNGVEINNNQFYRYTHYL